MPDIDLLILGGRVHTLDPADREAEAVAVAGDRIAAVGSSADLLGLAGDGTKVVDVAGRAVLPGLIDAHTHLELSAYARHCWHDIRALGRAAILEQVAELAGADTGDEWLVLQGTFGQDLPSREELDAVAPRRPVAVRWTMHRFVLNTAALRTAELDRRRPPPVGARIGRAPGGGLSGIVDEGWDLLGWRPPTGDVLADALADTLATAYLTHGVTSVYEVLASSDALRQYRRLADAGRLPVRVQAVATLPPGHQPVADLDAFETMGVARSLGDPWVRLAGVKIFLDGGRHAALRSSGLELPPREWGLLTRTPTMLAHEVGAAVERGLQVWIHALGDLSQRITVAAVEDAVDFVDAGDHRTRIEHLGNELYPAGIPLGRLTELGVIAVPNPTFVFAEPDDPADRLPPGVEKYALRSLRDAGQRPPGNSDTAGAQPFATSPWFGISCMLGRRNRNGVVVSPAERITLREAVRAYTIDAAYAGFEEHEKGSIEVGKLADLAILTKDPFSCAESELSSITSAATLVGGRAVHVGPGLAAAFAP